MVEQVRYARLSEMLTPLGNPVGTSGSRGPGNAIGWPDPSYSSLDVTPRISANALFFPFPKGVDG